MGYLILTDSSADLPAKMVESLGLRVIPMGITIGGVSFNHFPDERELSLAEFYKRLRSGEPAATSAASPSVWMDEMERGLEEGKDLLVISFSSGLSSTFENACAAASEMREKYPDRKIEVVDSLSATLGQGLIVYTAVKKQEEGLGLQENKEFLEKHKYHVCHFFTVDDLGHLRRGGRISATTAVVGSALGIKPVLHVDDGGHLVSIGKARGRKNSLTALLDHMEEEAIEPETQFVTLGHADCREDADELALEIKRRFKVKEILVDYVGPVAGAHAGPGTMALFFVGKKR